MLSCCINQKYSQEPYIVKGIVIKILFSAGVVLLICSQDYFSKLGHADLPYFLLLLGN